MLHWWQVNGTIVCEAFLFTHPSTSAENKAGRNYPFSSLCFDRNSNPVYHIQWQVLHPTVPLTSFNIIKKLALHLFVWMLIEQSL